MNRFFNMDNKFFVFMGRVADLLLLNFLCILCCIPVVTAGASITALYYVTLKMARDEESYIARSFFRSFKQNFKQSTIINIIMLLELGFGAAFELPLVIFYLSIFHLVPYKTLREQWRYIYVGLLVGSAVVTPDASPVTMFLMFGAVVVLYELSLFAARRVLVARDGKESLKWTREEYSEHKFNDED